MTRKINLVVSLMMLTAAMLLSAPIAHADNLLLTINSPVVGAPGDTLTISGTIANLSQNTVNLNGDFVVLAGISWDDNPFLTGAPLSMAPGQTWTGDILTVFLASNQQVGTYGGIFQILGDIDGSGALNPLNGDGTPFQVQVVPEPSSMLLLGSGLIGAVGTIRRRFTR